MKRIEKNKKYTLTLSSESENKMKDWVLELKSLKSVLPIAFLSVGIVLFALIVVVNKSFSSNNTAFQSSNKTMDSPENDILLKKIAKLESTLQKNEESLKRIEQFEQRLRQMSKFGKKQTLAMGGLNSKPAISSENWNVKNAPGKKLDSMLDMSQLFKSKTELREQSLQHLYELMQDEESLMSATPSIWPVRGWISSHFGPRISPFNKKLQHHHGIDIPAPTGTKIVSPADGTVVKVSTESGYGKLLTIRHGYGIVTRYGHNSKVLVKQGDKVKRGQAVAEVGNTGNSTGPHLHYEVRINGVPVNPSKYLKN